MDPVLRAAGRDVALDPPLRTVGLEVVVLGGGLRTGLVDPPLLTVGRGELVLPPLRTVELAAPPLPLFTLVEGLVVPAPEIGGVVLGVAEEPEVGLRSSTGRLVPVLGAVNGVTMLLEGRRAAPLSTAGAAAPEDPLMDLPGTAVGDPAEGALALG